MRPQSAGKCSFRNQAYHVKATSTSGQAIMNTVGNALVISAEKRSEDESIGEDWCRCERRFGAFRRVIELPQSVEADKARAESDGGIVTVRIPKRPDVRPRPIEIKPAAAGGR